MKQGGIFLTKIKAVLFDLDGVLIDAREWHYEALNRSLRLFGYEINRYDHLVTYDGLPTRKKLEMMTLEKGLPVKLHPFLNDLKQEYTLELIHTFCKPFFRHQFALSRLQSEGFKLAVCSNSMRGSLDLMLKKADISQYFSFTLTNQDVSHSKPHPEIYQKAMARFELKPQECLVLEDNQHGIEACLASGAHLLHIRTPQDLSYDLIKYKIAEIEKSEG